MSTRAPSSADPVREALLYVEWARGAGGPLLPAETPAPALPEPALPEPARDGGAEPQDAGDTGMRDEPAPAGPEREAALCKLTADVADCKRCGLAATRRQTVFGEGSAAPRLVIVGEAPGAEEDRTGRPFVGPAGQLLTRMLAAIGLGREDVFICNLLKCRPPGNRNPRPDEVASCKPFLREQLRLLGGPLILALGSPATRELLQTRRGITSLRGRFARTPDGHRVMPTFHPAYLLRNPAAKREVWGDLKKVAGELGLSIPQKGRPSPGA